MRLTREEMVVAWTRLLAVRLGENWFDFGLILKVEPVGSPSPWKWAVRASPDDSI